MQDTGEITSSPEKVEETCCEAQSGFIYLIILSDDDPPEVMRYPIHDQVDIVMKYLERKLDCRDLTVMMSGTHCDNKELVTDLLTNRNHTWKELTDFHHITNVLTLDVSMMTVNRINLDFFTAWLPLTWSTSIDAEKTVQDLYKMVEEHYGTRNFYLTIKISNLSKPDSDGGFMLSLSKYKDTTLRKIVEDYFLGTSWNVHVILIDTDMYYILNGVPQLIAQDVKLPIYVIIIKDGTSKKEGDAILIPIDSLNVHSTVNDLYLKFTECCQESLENCHLEVYIKSSTKSLCELNKSSKYLWEICKKVNIQNTWFVKKQQNTSKFSLNNISPIECYRNQEKANKLKFIETSFMSKNAETTSNSIHSKTICCICLCDDYPPTIKQVQITDQIMEVYNKHWISIFDEPFSIYAHNRSNDGIVTINSEEIIALKDCRTLGDVLNKFNMANTWFIQKQKTSEIVLHFQSKIFEYWKPKVTFSCTLEKVYEMVRKNKWFRKIKSDDEEENFLSLISSNNSKYVLKDDKKAVGEIAQEFCTGPVWMLQLSQVDKEVTYQIVFFFEKTPERAPVVIIMLSDQTLMLLINRLEKLFEEQFEPLNGYGLTLFLLSSMPNGAILCQLEKTSTKLEEIAKTHKLLDGAPWLVSVTKEKTSHSKDSALFTTIFEFDGAINKTSNDYSGELGLPFPSKAIAYVGLVNQAMTCYLNSLLQTLFMTPELRNSLYMWSYTPATKQEEANNIAYQLMKLFLNLQTSERAAVETTALTESFGWDSSEAWQQHDIQELCRVMFDALEKSFEKIDQADFINNLYEGKMRDYVKCLECQTVKSREDKFFDIPLPLRSFSSTEAYSSVQEALRAFVQPEKLDGNNQYFCEKCNKKCDAHKGLAFVDFPYLLTLHLKRFDFDYNTCHRIKLNDRVTFPNILHLNSFIESLNEMNGGEEDHAEDECLNHLFNPDHGDDEGIDLSNGFPSTSAEHYVPHVTPEAPYVYELFSIMIHSGSANGGHYYAYIKDLETGEWMCFNDTSVMQITQEDVQKSFGGGRGRLYYSSQYGNSTNAYMLMYRQIDKKRNAKFMSPKDFPAHITELVRKMKESEENAKQAVYIRCKDRVDSWQKLDNFKGDIIAPTYCHSKAFHILTLHYNKTWAQETRSVWEEFMPDNAKLDQCRLVLYDPEKDVILKEFDGREEELVRNILKDLSDQEVHLALDVRDCSVKQWLAERRLAPMKIQVYEVKVMEEGVDIVNGPIKFHIKTGETTVRQLKEEIAPFVKIELSDMKLLSLRPKGLVFLKNDDLVLDEYACKFVVTSSFDVHPRQNFIESALDNFGEVFSNLLTIYVQSCDTSKATLEELGISSLETYNSIRDTNSLSSNSNYDRKLRERPRKRREAINSASCSFDFTCLTTSPAKEVDVPWAVDKMNSSSSINSESVLDNDLTNGVRKQTSEYLSAADIALEELAKNNSKSKSLNLEKDDQDWESSGREQSNSEDSSLSDSDRTLVGDPPEEKSALSEESVGTWYATWRQTNRNDEELTNSEYKFYFNLKEVTGTDPQSTPEYKIFLDKRMRLCQLKSRLEPIVQVPSSYFNLCFSQTNDNDKEDGCEKFPVNYTFDFEKNASMQVFDDLTRFKIGLKKGQDTREKCFTIYHLKFNNVKMCSYLFELSLSSDTPVAQVKLFILVELKKQYNIVIPLARCRLRGKEYGTPTKVYLDDQTIDWNETELFIQELSEPETVTDSNQIIIFVCELRRSIILDSEVGTELVFNEREFSKQGLKERVMEISKISEDSLVLKKSKVSVGEFMEMKLDSRFKMWDACEENFCVDNVTNGAFFLYMEDKKNYGLEEVAERLVPHTARYSTEQPMSRVRQWKPEKTDRSLKIKVNSE